MALEHTAKLVVSKRTPTYPWSIFQESPNPQMEGIPNHKVLVESLGYVPGVCWKILSSLNRWQVTYNHPIGNIYKWYISGILPANLGHYISPIPPIKGTRFHSIDF